MAMAMTVPVVPQTPEIQSAPVVQIAEVPQKKVNKYGMDMELENRIKETFGKDGDIMVAVALAESEGRVEDAVGYNCWSGGRSVPCPKDERENAWSVDCGLFQINTRGNVCPEHLFDAEKNLERARQIYKEQGIGAWWAYKNGSYKKYLDYDSVVTVVDLS